MERFAFNLVYGEYAGSEYSLVLLGFILGAIATGVIQKTQSKMNRSTFFLTTGFLTFASALTNLPWLFIWYAIELGVLWVIVVIQFAVMCFIGGFYATAAKQRSLDAFGNTRYAILAFLPLVNIYFLIKRTKDNYSPELKTKSVGLNIAGAIFAFVCAAGSNAALEKSISEELVPNSEQKVLIGEKLLKYLSVKQYAETYVFPSFTFPFALDDYNSITKLSVVDDTIVNTILHTATPPLTASETVLLNVKKFICDRWSWILVNNTKVSYNLEDAKGNKLFAVKVGNEDCADN